MTSIAYATKSALRERIGITEVGALSMWVRSIVGSTYRVQFVNGAETAYVDMHGNMVIPTPNSSMTVRDAIRLRGFCIHETSHPRYQPQIFAVMKAHPVPNGHPLGGIYNVLLDVHAETMRYKEWPGDGKALSEFAAVVGRDVYERLEKALKDTGNVFPPNFEKMCMVMTACRNAEAVWNIGMDIGFRKLVDELYTPEIRKGARDLEDKFHLVDRLINHPEDEDEWSIWKLSCEIYEYLWEEPASNATQPKPGKKEGEKGEGEESEAEAGSPSGGNPEEGEGESVEAKEKIKIEEILWSDHYETMRGGGSGQGFDYSNYRTNAQYTPIDPDKFTVIDYRNRRR